LWTRPPNDGPPPANKVARVNPQPRAPLWKKKRWQAAAALWLLVPIAYVLAEGPLTCFSAHTGTPDAPLDFLYPAVVTDFVDSLPLLGPARAAWVDAWRPHVYVQVYDVTWSFEPALIFIDWSYLAFLALAALLIGGGIYFLFRRKP
jgi:hypothetical protein